jgi:hypothetical protein
MKILDQLMTRSFPSLQRSSRNGQRIVRAQLHHGATTNAVWMRDVMVSGGKQVSANAICTVDGEFWDIVNRNFRAWTSSDAEYDRGSFTVETQNLSTNGWTISRASHEALAQLCAALSVEYGWGRLNRSGPFSTWNVVGHREIYQFLGRSYATACPGGMDLDWIVRRGNEILDNREEDDMFDDAAREILTSLRDEIRGLSQRIERVEAVQGTLSREGIVQVGQITDEVKAAEGRIISVVTREGKGARAYQCTVTRRTVVISEDGKWWRDLSGAANPTAEVDQLASVGWCQKDIKPFSFPSDFEYHMRNANRTFLQANPLPDSLTGVKAIAA